MILQLILPESSPIEDDGGTWGELVAWFSELVIRLDKGDMAGVIIAQSHIERHGFTVTFRRRPRLRREANQ